MRFLLSFNDVMHENEKKNDDSKVVLSFDVHDLLINNKQNNNITSSMQN